MKKIEKIIGATIGALMLGWSVWFWPVFALALAKDRQSFSFDCLQAEPRNGYAYAFNEAIIPILSGTVYKVGEVTIKPYGKAGFVSYQTHDDYLLTLYPINSPLQVGDNIMAEKTILGDYDLNFRNQISQHQSKSFSELLTAHAKGHPEVYVPIWLDIRDMRQPMDASADAISPCDYTKISPFLPRKRKLQADFANRPSLLAECHPDPALIYTYPNMDGIDGSGLEVESGLLPIFIEAVDEKGTLWPELVVVHDGDDADYPYDVMRYFNFDPNPLLKEWQRMESKHNIVVGHLRKTPLPSAGLMPFHFFSSAGYATHAKPSNFDMVKQELCQK